MNLHDRYLQIDPKHRAEWRRRVAEKARISQVYLWQLATHARTHPKVVVLARLAEADRKLTLRALINEFGGEEKNREALARR